MGSRKFRSNIARVDHPFNLPPRLSQSRLCQCDALRLQRLGNRFLVIALAVQGLNFRFLPANKVM
jgi:hypothetical protein